MADLIADQVRDRVCFIGSCGCLKLCVYNLMRRSYLSPIPTVFRERGAAFFSNEGAEPPHLHIRKHAASALEKWHEHFD